MGRLLTAREVADRLAVSLATAYREMRLYMQHVVVGQRALSVSERALEDYVRCRTHEPVATQREDVVTRRRTRGSNSMAAEAVRKQVPADEPGHLILRPVYPRTEPRLLVHPGRRR